jgi:hypothetical protein
MLKGLTRLFEPPTQRAKMELRFDRLLIHR